MKYICSIKLYDDVEQDFFYVDGIFHCERSTSKGLPENKLYIEYIGECDLNNKLEKLLLLKTIEKL
jgi:hypothetical protein